MTNAIPIPIPSATNERLLHVEQLRVAYRGPVGSVPVVQGVSFMLGQEKLAVVGESGSGKTTVGRALLRLLPRHAEVSACRLRFDGLDLLTASEEQMSQLRGQRLSMIMQDPRYSLNPVMPVGAQIGEAVLRTEALRRGACRDRVEQLLARVHIREPRRVAAQYPHQLSGGMGQRVMIAMMLAQQPRLLVADEPTSALDVSVRREVLDLLDELVAEQGLMLLFITHDLHLVGRFSGPGAGDVRGPCGGSPGRGRSGPGRASLHPGAAERGAQPAAAARGCCRCCSATPPGAPDDHAPRSPCARARPAPDAGRTAAAPPGTARRLPGGPARPGLRLVGDPGSGKTTVLRCLAGQYRHWQGEVTIAGQPLTGGPRARPPGAWWSRPDLALARQVQMVHQDPYASLHPRHTVHTALAEPLRVHRMDALDARIDQALTQVGLPLSFRHRYPHQLSGGQRQRVAIAGP